MGNIGELLVKWGFSAPGLGLGDICLRLLCATVVGMIIGIEREHSRRPAGMRTHILVALGSCVVMIISQIIFYQYKELGASPDPARLSAQVITGVGFLGAGTIMREGATVKGLTTAASLWAVACLGIAAGGGYYGVAIVGMLFIFIALSLFEILEEKMVAPKERNCTYILEVANLGSALNGLTELGMEYRVRVSEIKITGMDSGNQRITFHGDIRGIGWKKRRQLFLQELAQAAGVISLSELTKVRT